MTSGSFIHCIITVRLLGYIVLPARNIISISCTSDNCTSKGMVMLSRSYCLISSKYLNSTTGYTFKKSSNIYDSDLPSHIFMICRSGEENEVLVRTISFSLSCLRNGRFFDFGNNHCFDWF